MRIDRATITVHRLAIGKPVVTSFGVMTSRPLVLLQLFDGEGARGWGEIWCNFPAVTAEHRARLAASILPDLVIGKTFGDIPAAFDDLSRKLRILAIQSGEPGPVSSVLAAVDQALWDLRARRQALPLRRLLDPEAADRVPVYASGINPTGAAETVDRAASSGHRAFKLKIGFDEAVDRQNVAAITARLGAGQRLFVDANQGWSLNQAIAGARWLCDHGVSWLEEPLPADSDAADWRALSVSSDVPLAGGENLSGTAAITHALDWLTVVQPDLGKWGGVSGCSAVGRLAVQQGRIYCPHWLGGGPGLLHSAAVLAAIGGDGLLEMDVNDNPLRDDTLSGALAVSDGQVTLPETAGCGPEPDLRGIATWLEAERSLT